MAEWKRKEWTTKCADPTVVVEWSLHEAGGKITRIREFQGVYTSNGDMTEEQAKEIHCKLEGEFQNGQNAVWNLQHGDAEAAERKAGWDPRPLNRR